MQCQLCSFTSMNEKSEALEMLKEHYIYDHLVCKINYHFKQLCDIQFKENNREGQVQNNMHVEVDLSYILV